MVIRFKTLVARVCGIKRLIESNGLLHAGSCAVGNLVTISHGSCYHASEPFYQELSDRSQFSHNYNMTVCSRRTKEYFGSSKVAGSYQTIINPVSTERVIIIIPYVDLLQEFDYFDHGINSVLLRLVKTKSLFRHWRSLNMFKTKFHIENH